MELDLWMPGQPGLHVGRSVRRGVVQNHMKLAIRVGPDNLVHEGQKVDCRMSVADTMRDFAGGGLQHSIKIHNAVALVIMRVTDRTPGAQWQGALRGLRAP